MNFFLIQFIINQLPVLVMKISYQKEAKRQQISEEVEEKKQGKSSLYIPGERNGKWSEEQHMKYIAYIDFYKQKMRSKQKRRQICVKLRSNEFYKQMSNFIGTRNGLQCRSHHQKLQQKYIYTNKIIAAFKQKFELERYRQELATLKKEKTFRQQNKQYVKDGDCLPVSVRTYKNVEVQTDLQGIGFNYILVDSITPLLNPQIPSLGFHNSSYFYPSNITIFQQQNMPNYPETYPTKSEY